MGPDGEAGVDPQLPSDPRNFRTRRLRESDERRQGIQMQRILGTSEAVEAFIQTGVRDRRRGGCRWRLSRTRSSLRHMTSGGSNPPEYGFRVGAGMNRRARDAASQTLLQKDWRKRGQRRLGRDKRGRRRRAGTKP